MWAQNGLTDISHQQDHHDHVPLLDLPNELILTIASFLDKDSQLILSLSCRPLRLLLDLHLDLTFSEDEKATKVRFLQNLELDHPEYLTCRSCGILYLWQEREWVQYYCPRRHLIADVLVTYGHSIQAGSNFLWVDRAVIDLILRASEHGPAHGLPVSFLNSSGQDEDGISQTHEAQLVDSQLILASRSEVDAESGREMEVMTRLLIRNVCLHSNTTVRVICDILDVFKPAFASMTVGADKLQVVKCFFCETDHEVYANKVAENRTRMVLKVWRNYGQRYGNKLSNEQIFHRHPVMRLDSDTLWRRDVRAAFESSTECTQSIES